MNPNILTNLVLAITIPLALATLIATAYLVAVILTASL